MTSSAQPAAKKEWTLSEMLANSPRKLRHVLRAQDFGDRGYITEIFSIADYLEKHRCDLMQGKTLLWFATEPSTRTRLSFSAAARALGGSVEAVSSHDSSQEKGESIEDTVLSIAKIGAADIIVLRHSDEDAIWRAAFVSPIPLINGGSGAVHHPTQALLDVYTIFKTVGKLDGLSIALVGDLKYGRTTNSLAYLLSKFTGVKIYLVSPGHLRMKGELVYYLHSKCMEPEEMTDLEWVVDKVDVIYQTRKQKERSADTSEHQGLSSYTLDRKLVGRMQKGAVILHPLPRNEELPREIDRLPQAKYLDQMHYGMLIRTALLAKILG